MSEGIAAPSRSRWRVPILGGATLQLYRLVWVALFALAAVSVFYVGPRNEITLQERYLAASALGIVAYGNESPDGMLGGPFDDAARKAGIRDFDLLVAVDGRRLPADDRARAAMMAGADGTTATLTIRRSTGGQVNLAMTRDSRRLQRAYEGSGLTLQSRRWLQFGVYFLAGLAALSAAVLLFVRRSRDPVAQMLSAALVMSAMSSFDLGFLTVLLAFGTVLGTLAILLFPDGRFNTPWHWLAMLLAAVEAGLFVFLYFYPSDPPIRSVIGVLTPVSLIVAVVMQYRRTPVGVARQQGKFVLFGIVASGLFMLLGNGLLSLETATAGSGQVWLVLLKHLSWALASLALPAGLLASILRYRLYDAESAISHSVVYGALTLFLLAIFAGSEKVIEVLGEEYFGHELGALAGGLGAAVAAVMVAPLHHRITHWAEKRFQGQLIGLHKELPLLVGDMRETSTASEVAEASLLRVSRGVRAVRGAVIVDDVPLGALHVEHDALAGWLTTWSRPANGALDIDRDDRLFPVRLPLEADGVGRVGWLLLGPRPDGSLFGKDEREVLCALADPLARALAIAGKRERREAEHRAELASIWQRIAEIEPKRRSRSKLAAG